MVWNQIRKGDSAQAGECAPKPTGTTVISWPRNVHVDVHAESQRPVDNIAGADKKKRHFPMVRWTPGSFRSNQGSCLSRSYAQLLRPAEANHAPGRRIHGTSAPSCFKKTDESPSPAEPLRKQKVDTPTSSGICLPSSSVVSVSTIFYSAKISSLNPTTSHLSRFTWNTSVVYQHVFAGCFFDYSRTPWSSSTSWVEKSPSLTHCRDYLSKTPMLFRIWRRRSIMSSRSSVPRFWATSRAKQPKTSSSTCCAKSSTPVGQKREARLRHRVDPIGITATSYLLKMASSSKASASWSQPAGQRSSSRNSTLHIKAPRRWSYALVLLSSKTESTRI